MVAAPAAAHQALALYRRGLALSRQLADPCLRHYAFGRLTHVFRREQHETSVTRVRALLHDGRKGVRRLARAVAGEPDDVRHLLELAYGKRGRVMHVLARARALEPRGLGPLAAVPPAAPAGDAAAGGAGAGAALLALLERRVPTRWWPGRAQPGGALSAADAPPPAQHAPDWEATHCTLLERAFLPSLAARVSQLPRAQRRLHEAAFALPRAVLRLQAAPPAAEGQPPALAALTWRGGVVGRVQPPPPREQLRKRRQEPPAAPKQWGDAPPRPPPPPPPGQQQSRGQQLPRSFAADAVDDRRATG